MLALVAALCLGAAAVPSSAQAYEQQYCNVVVSPFESCPSSGLHTWYFNEGIVGYEGATVCVYMWNAHNEVVRGEDFPCEYGHVEQEFSRPHNAWYNSRVYNGTTSYSFILVGHAVA